MYWQRLVIRKCSDWSHRNLFLFRWLFSDVATIEELQDLLAATVFGNGDAAVALGGWTGDEVCVDYDSSIVDQWDTTQHLLGMIGSY